MHNGPRADCADVHKDWYPFRSVCYADMAAKAADWMYDDLHKDAEFHDGTFTRWSKDRSQAFPYHYRDGVVIGVAPVDLAPHDMFTTQAEAPPIPPAKEGGDLSSPHVESASS